MTPTLSLRQLNRALLARQMLLQRENHSAVAATKRLIALQAQVTNPPYIGLWTRLHNFQRDELTEAMAQRQIVRAPLLRSTLHLITAEDFAAFRVPLQAALTKGLNGFFGQRMKGLDPAAVVNASEIALREQPRAFSALKEVFAQTSPDYDEATLSYVVRTHLPLVMTHPYGVWSTGGKPAYALGDDYLGHAINPDSDARELVRRYLAGFGPSSVKDIQSWAGLTTWKDDISRLKPELVTYKDERGVELLDLPDAPMPDENTPTPIRFIPEYDNLVLSHADRTRIVPDAYRKSVFLSAGRIASTVLIDGFVGGVWKISREKKAALLTIELFALLSPTQREEIEREGDALLRWVQTDAVSYEIKIIAS